MPTWVKVVLVIVLVGFVLLVGGAIVAARWVRSRGESLKEQGKVLITEAEQFGKEHDEEACVTETLTRLRTCPGFICEAKMKVFLQTCLNVADESPELCTDVPLQTELTKSGQWMLEECQRRGFPRDQRCMRTVSGVQAFCAER